MSNLIGSDDEDEFEFKAPVKKLKLEKSPISTDFEPSDDYMEFSVEEDKLVDSEGSKKNSLETSLLERKSIGLSMMQRMGFSIGDSLGLSKDAAKEPVKVVPKHDKLGIGASSKLRIKQNLNRQTVDRYLRTQSVKERQRRATCDILKLQRFCLNSSGDVDRIQSIEQAKSVNCLWRSLALEMVCKPRNGRIIDHKTEASSTSEFESAEPTSKLEHLSALLDYARENHFYCLYCSVEYNDAEDMRAHCPGKYVESHTL
ncbi:hypothetical protein ACQ2H7_001641 [Candidozyma auris]